MHEFYIPYGYKEMVPAFFATQNSSCYGRNMAYKIVLIKLTDCIVCMYYLLHPPQWVVDGL